MNTTVLKERLANLDSVFSGAGRKDDGPSRALVLDLSDESFYDWEIPEQFLEAYVAGPALGARLWAEFAGADVEEESTYESNNPVVLTVSSLSNSGMPGCESLSIAFRSPVSGTLRFNVVSNTFGMRLHGMGYAALIITGRLRRPAVIDIRKSGVVYNISEAFIGFTVSQVEQLVKTGPMTTAMSIGPAGEQKVPFAAVVSEGAVTGRGGLGCVFGYKNIKALCITGFETSFIRRGNPEDISKALEKLSKILGDSPYCKAMQRGGSSSLVKLSSKNGWAPVFNFSRRTDPRLFHLGGDEVARRYGQNHGGCIGCPVLCRHRTRDGITVPDYDAVHHDNGLLVGHQGRNSAEHHLHAGIVGVSGSSSDGESCHFALNHLKRVHNRSLNQVFVFHSCDGVSQCAAAYGTVTYDHHFVQKFSIVF